MEQRRLGEAERHRPEREVLGLARLVRRQGRRDAVAMANVGGTKVVMFGGGSDTWEWDGNNWTYRSPAQSPSARQYLQGATRNGNVLIFGGASGNTSFNDTWLWDGTNWAQQSPASPPGARNRFAMGPTGTGVLMFGGYKGATTTAETWEWAGNAWVARPNGPGARLGVFLAAR